MRNQGLQASRARSTGWDLCPCSSPLLVSKPYQNTHHPIPPPPPYPPLPPFPTHPVSLGSPPAPLFPVRANVRGKSLGAQPILFPNCATHLELIYDSHLSAPYRKIMLRNILRHNRSGFPHFYDLPRTFSIFLQRKRSKTQAWCSALCPRMISL